MNAWTEQVTELDHVRRIFLVTRGRRIAAETKDSICSLEIPLMLELAIERS